VAGVDLPSNPARLRWRCRRGMRELDVILERYLTERFPGASPALQQAFVALLELQDPDLAALLLGQATAEGDLAALIGDITRPKARELSATSPVYECDPASGRLPGAGP
jgi:antitoxin CptB